MPKGDHKLQELGLDLARAYNARSSAIKRLPSLPAGSCAILTISPDRFTRVNGLIGFRLGDEVLALIQGRIASTLNLSDLLVQLPGDAFAVVLEPQPFSALEPLIGRLQDLLQRTYVVQGQIIHLTVSIGAAVGSDEEASEATLRNAMLALKAAKAKGLGALTLFSQPMRDKELLDQRLALDINKALLCDEFELSYQPQVDMQSDALTGYEALIRWNHPKLGRISPSKFIALAEEANLLRPLGAWILDSACQEAISFCEQTTIAVNVAPAQLASEDFCNIVERTLARIGLPAQKLIFEVTEGVLLHDEYQILKTLNELQKIGTRVAIDDFGSGCFSLRRLAEVPCDIIKIHPSLLWNSERQRAIVRAITSLATNLGMSTIAEGIETQEQALQARQDGCTIGQGFLYGGASPRIHGVA